MSSLAALKAKLEKKKKRASEDPGTSGHVTWENKLSEEGHSPRIWLEYIDDLKRKVTYPDDFTRYNRLCIAYDRAIKEIPVDQNKENGAFARLFLQYADLKRPYDIDGAEAIIEHALHTVRKFAVVHIAAAELQIEQGDDSKAKKKLSKANLLYKAQPCDLLAVAVHNLEDGQSILLSKDERERGFDTVILRHSHEAHNVVILDSKDKKDDYNTAPLSLDHSNSVPNSESKHGIRHYKSTPECHSISSNVFSANKWKRPVSVSVDLPTRVKIKSFDSTGVVEMNEDDTMDSFKPFDSLKKNVLSCHVEDPKMSTTHENSKDKKDDYNTAPLSLDHSNSVPNSESKHGIRHYKSTPECHSISSNAFSANKWKRPTNVSVGPPMRVKIKPFDSTCVEETNEDDTMDSFKPLDSFQKKSNETFGAQSSGYISSTTHDLTDVSQTQDMVSQDYEAFEQEMGPSSSHSTQELVSNDNINSDGPVESKRQCTESLVTKFKTPTIELTNPYHSSRKNSDTLPTAPKYVVSTCVDPEKSHVAETQVSSSHQQAESLSNQMKESSVHNPGTGLSNFPPIEVHQPTPPPVLPEKIVEQVPVIQPTVDKPAPPPQFNNQMVTPMKTGSDIKVVNGISYAVLKVAGKGGSAKVYQVLDCENNVRALKCVDLEGSTDIIIQGYKNEINLLKRLQYCDSVIKMFDYDFDKIHNKLNVIMEYGETDLATNLLIRKKGGKKLGETTVKFYWQEMLGAVNALHKEGIIHSDLKPANFIFVAANLKLIDFGIADAVQQDKTSVLKETLVGTLSYMSPEAIMESCDAPARYKIGMKSDVWSLGCILYNMVYNKTPFQHIRNQIAKIQAITSDKHVIEFPDIPDKNLLSVLKTCLVREPKQRPTTDELLLHPYIAMKSNSDSPVASMPKQKNLMKIMEQISEFSPRSMQRLQGMMEQMGSGKNDNSQIESHIPAPGSPISHINNVATAAKQKLTVHAATKTGRPPLQCIYLAK